MLSFVILWGSFPLVFSKKIALWAFHACFFRLPACLRAMFLLTAEKPSISRKWLLQNLWFEIHLKIVLQTMPPWSTTNFSVQPANSKARWFDSYLRFLISSKLKNKNVAHSHQNLCIQGLHVFHPLHQASDICSLKKNSYKWQRLIKILFQLSSIYFDPYFARLWEFCFSRTVLSGL